MHFLLVVLPSTVPTSPLPCTTWRAAPSFQTCSYTQVLSLGRKAPALTQASRRRPLSPASLTPISSTAPRTSLCHSTVPEGAALWHRGHDHSRYTVCYCSMNWADIYRKLCPQEVLLHWRHGKDTRIPPLGYLIQLCVLMRSTEDRGLFSWFLRPFTPL